jgi:hypothetical protein
MLKMKKKKSSSWMVSYHDAKEILLRNTRHDIATLERQWAKGKSKQ